MQPNWGLALLVAACCLANCSVVLEQFREPTPKACHIGLDHRCSPSSSRTPCCAVLDCVRGAALLVLQVNPRVQVEHTVTEEVTGIDIVQSQLRIAAGASLADLGITCQEDVKCYGVAIQTRITTEDPAMNFQPNVGRLEVYRTPGGMGVRVDSAMMVGTAISPHYDSLLTKLTVRASTFQQAVQKVRADFAVWLVCGSLRARWLRDGATVRAALRNLRRSGCPDPGFAVQKSVLPAALECDALAGSIPVPRLCLQRPCVVSRIRRRCAATPRVPAPQVCLRLPVLIV